MLQGKAKLRYVCASVQACVCEKEYACMCVHLTLITLSSPSTFTKLIFEPLVVTLL